MKDIHPFKSTTHQEKFFHFTFPQFPKPDHIRGNVTHKTVFLRKEDNGNWYAAVAYCSAKDHFSREQGRKIARRHYFTCKNSNQWWVCNPTWEIAKGII